MPRIWFWCTCASLVGAITLLIISMLDLGYLSMWLNPCASVYTILYHVGVLVIAHRKRNPENPSYFSTAIFSGYLLAIIWLAAFILTIIVLALGGAGDFNVKFLRQYGLPVNVHTQRVQVFLTLYEMVMVGGMAAKGHAIVESHGPDPPDWRYEADDQKQDVESVISMYM